MGLGGMMFGDDTPQRQIAELPDDAKAIVEDDYKRASEPIETQYGLIDKQLSNPSPIVGNIDDAIKQKYSGLVGSRLENFRQGEKIGARSKQLSRIKTAQNALLAKQQVTSDIFARNMEDQQMQEAARAEALSSILGFAGSVGGAYMGSQQQQKTKAKVSNASSTQQQGMTKSRNYLESIQGVTDRQGPNLE